MAAKRRAKNRTRGMDLWEVFPELVRPDDMGGRRDTRFRPDGTPERAYELTLSKGEEHWTWHDLLQGCVANPTVQESAGNVIFYLSDIERLTYIYLAESTYTLWRSDLLKEDDQSYCRNTLILAWRGMVEKCFRYLFLYADVWPSYHTWHTGQGGHYRAEGETIGTVLLTEREGTAKEAHGLEGRHSMTPIMQWTLDLYETMWTFNTMATMGLNVQGTDFGATGMAKFIGQAPFINISEFAVVPASLEWLHNPEAMTCSHCGRPIRFRYTSSVRLRSWVGTEYEHRDLCIECFLMRVETGVEVGDKIPILQNKDFLKFAVVPVNPEGFGQCEWKVAKESEPVD
jgi:hypothetical protein